MGEETKPKTAEEIAARMDEIAKYADERDLTSEEAQEYAALEKSNIAKRETAHVVEKHKAWSAPRASILPAAPRGDDALSYAFEHYMRTGQVNADMAGREVNGLPLQQYDQTLTTTAGGYLIPTTTEARMVEVMKNFGGIATVAEELPTAAGNPINYPTNDDTANTAEIDAVNVGMSSAGADLVFGQVTLGAFSYMAGGASNAALHVPFELVQDASFDITGMVTRKLGTRLGRKQASDFAIGTGTTLPQGLFDRIPDINFPSGNLTQTAAILYSTLTGNLAYVGGAATAGVIFTLDPDYLPNATWVMRYATLGILAAVTDTTGRPIFEPLGGSSWQQTDLTTGSTPGAPDSPGGYRPAGRLLGYPVIVDQASPAVGNASIAKPGAANDAFISFGDHRQAYVIRRVQGITLLVDPYTTMSKRQIGYFAWARADGKIQAAKAHVLAAGWNAA